MEYFLQEFYFYIYFVYIKYEMWKIHKKMCESKSHMLLDYNKIYIGQRNKIWLQNCTIYVLVYNLWSYVNDKSCWIIGRCIIKINLSLILL